MRNPDDEIEEQTDSVVPDEVRDYVEQLPGYREYQREIRGDALNFGDM